MFYASDDCLGLVAELNCRRIDMVLSLRMRINETLHVPPLIMRHLLAVRKLHHRFKQGDLRVNEVELGHVKELAEWLLEQYAECRNQTVRQDAFQWHAAAMISTIPLPVDRYGDICHAVTTGKFDSSEATSTH